MGSTFPIVLAFLAAVIGIYFVYQIVNILVTIIKETKRDKSLKLCLNTQGKVFYIILTVLFVLLFVGGIVASVWGIIHKQKYFYYNGIPIAAIAALVFASRLANLVFVGRKNMLVGRMQIDYRKMKKVDISYNNEMTFVYSQNNYKVNTRWVDMPTMRRAISRRS